MATMHRPRRHLPAAALSSLLIAACLTGCGDSKSPEPQRPATTETPPGRPAAPAVVQAPPRQAPKPAARPAPAPAAEPAQQQPQPAAEEQRQVVEQTEQREQVTRRTERTVEERREIARTEPQDPAPQATETPDASGPAEWLAAAEQFVDDYDLEAAESILTELIESSPRDYQVLALFGSLRYLQGAQAMRADDTTLAVERFVQSYNHYSGAVGVARRQVRIAEALHQGAGEAAAAAGLNEQALDSFRSAARVNNETQRAAYEVQTVSDLNRLAEAQVALTGLLALDSDAAYSHAARATVAMHRRDHNRARYHADEARRIDAASMPLRILEATVHRRSGRADQSLVLLHDLSSPSRAAEPVARAIAESFRTLDQPGKAAMAWELRSIVHPEAWPAAAQAAAAWLEAGQRETARWWYERARAVSPDAPEVEALSTAFQSASVWDR